MPTPRAISRGSWNEVVRSGWDRLSYRYRPRRASSDCFGHLERDYRAWLDPIRRALPRGSPVLDLGCGNGIPAARILSQRYRVTGVDISDVQVRRARRLVPRARFVRADLAEVDFPPGSFAAVISLYALIHVPREQHRPLLRKIAGWLVPGGWFLATLGHSAYEGRESGWLGSDTPMLWSHYDAATYRRGLHAAGFRIVREKFIPEGDGGHQLFLARKRALGPVRRTSAPKPGER
ncbi:MAG: methyltransferase domain-containing protein [Thermoplasmata archaeon]